MWFRGCVIGLIRAVGKISKRFWRDWGCWGRFVVGLGLWWYCWVSLRSTQPTWFFLEAAAVAFFVWGGYGFG